MNYDETRQFLESVRRTQEALAAAEGRVEALRCAATRTTTAWSEAPGGGGDVHKDGLVAALADAESACEEARAQAVIAVQAVSAFLARLPEDTCQQLLYLRYVALLPWGQVDEHLRKQGIYYSARHITRLHGQALNAARRLRQAEKKDEGKERDA